jgi:putative modified peptide
MPIVSFSTENLEKLMNKLSEDEKFRKDFQSNPKTAFAQYDMQIPDEVIPDKIELPSPEEIKAKKVVLKGGWYLVQG